MPGKKKVRPLLYIYQPFARTPSNHMQDIYRNKIEKQSSREEIEQEEVMEVKLPQKVEEEKMQPEIELMTENITEPILDQPVSPHMEPKVQPIEIPFSEKESTFFPQEEPVRSSFTKVKSFKEMNMKERLVYLVNFPKALPPVPCVFYTKDNNYQGYLLDYQEDVITIKFHDQTTATIPFHELENVLMIGIRK